MTLVSFSGWGELEMTRASPDTHVVSLPRWHFLGPIRWCRRGNFAGLAKLLCVDPRNVLSILPGTAQEGQYPLVRARPDGWANVPAGPSGLASAAAVAGTAAGWGARHAAGLTRPRTHNLPRRRVPRAGTPGIRAEASARGSGTGLPALPRGRRPMRRPHRTDDAGPRLSRKGASC